MNSKPLPRVEVFEKNILGNLIKNGKLVDKLNILEEDFYEERDKIILRAITDMMAEGLPVGDLEVREYLREKNLIEKVSGGFLYIGSLIDNVIQHNVEHEVRMLKEVANRRRLWKLGKRLAQTIENEVSQEGIEKLQMEIGKVENGRLPFSLKTETWDELIGTEEPELEFVVRDLIPAGCLTVLAGKPKVGKSLLGLLIALSVGLGVPLWDKEVTEGGVLFISTEDGKVRLKKRIWRMIDTPNRYHPNIHFYVSECNLSDEKTLRALKSKILEIKPKLVVLDPLINIFKKGELNSAEDMNRVLRPLQDLAKETGIAILVIHHTRKSGSEDSIDTIQGSITISGVADGILILKSLRRGDQEKKAVLEVILKDAEIPKKAVLGLDDKLRWNVEGDFDELEGVNLEQEIIRALSEDDSGLTMNNLMSITGAEYKPIYKATMKLEKGGNIRSDKIGKHHTKVFFLFSRENEGKTKKENENQDITNGNNSKKSGEKSSFSQSQNGENEMEHWENEKRDPQLELATDSKRDRLTREKKGLCPGCWKVKDACACKHL